VTDVGTYVSTWEKVAAIATAVGGVGAAIGAIAAWRAARASGQASRDARDALAASLKPQVHLRINQYGGPGQPVAARAVVLGPLSPAGLSAVLPATDVQIQFNLASGKQGSSDIPILQPGSDRWAQQPPYLSVVIEHPSEDWPPPDGDHVTATVSCSDVRGAARYQRSTSGELRRHSEPGVVSFSERHRGEETRIAP
jgi:hypothetical protein